MSHRPCPHCRTLNPPASPTCARCGASYYRQTIVYDQDADAPYWVETEARPAAADLYLSHIGRAVALTAATVAAEAAAGYMERRFQPNRPLAGPARPPRGRAWAGLAGVAMLFVEQALIAYVE